MMKRENKVEEKGSSHGYLEEIVKVKESRYSDDDDNDDDDDDDDDGGEALLLLCH